MGVTQQQNEEQRRGVSTIPVNEATLEGGGRGFYDARTIKLPLQVSLTGFLVAMGRIPRELDEKSS